MCVTDGYQEKTAYYVKRIMLDDREHSIGYRLVDYYFYMKYCIILGSWLCKCLSSRLKKSERRAV